MSQILLILSFWLHSLATITFIGHYVLLAVIYLPAMKDTSLDITGPILSRISKQSRNWMYTSLLIFLVTGVYLTFVDPNYLGIGDFGNFWSIMMLIKHLLIVVMIGAGFFFNAILRVGPMLISRSGAEQAHARFKLYINSMAIGGVLVVLLTALAQIQ